jgi:YebC/PmpR family DNA-binding regulatory protein
VFTGVYLLSFTAMSGHSKWAKIKRQKGITDQKRGAMFTKYARNIVLAAKEGGGDPDSNFSLRLAMDKAKAINMPAENIERAIKKATGEGAKSNIEKLAYEALMPSGAMFIIDCQTDNTNRTISEVKKIVESHGGKMASLGSVSWQFQEKGLVVVKPAKLKKAEKYGAEDTYEAVDKDELEMTLLDVPGVTDIEDGEEEDDAGNKFPVFYVYTAKGTFANAVKEIEKMQLKIISFEIIKEPANKVNVAGENAQKAESMVEALNDQDDVDEVWTYIA